VLIRCDQALPWAGICPRTNGFLCYAGGVALKRKPTAGLYSPKTAARRSCLAVRGSGRGEFGARHGGGRPSYRGAPSLETPSADGIGITPISERIFGEEIEAWLKKKSAWASVRC